jgi:hypothetical protein
MQLSSRLGIFLITLAGVIVGACLVLMTVDVPPPQTPIETPLDAKIFLQEK